MLLWGEARDLAFKFTRLLGSQLAQRCFFLPLPAADLKEWGALVIFIPATHGGDDLSLRGSSSLCVQRCLPLQTRSRVVGSQARR